MSEGQKLTPAQQAATQMQALGAKVDTAGQKAVQTAQRAPGIIQAARDASLQTTARTAGRSAAQGRQAGGWGMGSSMQALAANLAGSDQMAGQRATFATQEQEARQAGAQASLDQSMFMEQRKQAEIASETQALTDINNIMLNIQSTLPKDSWGAEIAAKMSPYLNDPGTPVNAKMTILNTMSRMWHVSNPNRLGNKNEMRQYMNAVQAMHPEVNIELMAGTQDYGYDTFQAINYGEYA